jgi:Cu/Ag efflux pump CusA
MWVYHVANSVANCLSPSIVARWHRPAASGFGDSVSTTTATSLMLRPTISGSGTGANAVVVTEDLLARMKSVAGRLVPSDINVTVTRDYGDTANEKANELLFHLALATVSIVVLIALAIGWREALVTLVVIPTTILLTLFASKTMGYTINRVSLFM